MYPSFSLEWLAGFFDGEGCVTIDHTTNGGDYRIFRLKVSISQKNQRILRAIKMKFGGYLGKHHNRVGSISWNGPKAVSFLSAILPHLQLKREVALLGLEHRKLIGLPRKGHGDGPGSCLPKGTMRRHLVIRRKIQALNQKD